MSSEKVAEANIKKSLQSWKLQCRHTKITAIIIQCLQFKHYFNGLEIALKTYKTISVFVTYEIKWFKTRARNTSFVNFGTYSWLRRTCQGSLHHRHIAKKRGCSPVRHTWTLSRCKGSGQFAWDKCFRPIRPGSRSRRRNAISQECICRSSTWIRWTNTSRWLQGKRKCTAKTL